MSGGAQDGDEAMAAALAAMQPSFPGATPRLEGICREFLAWPVSYTHLTLPTNREV